MFYFAFGWYSHSWFGEGEGTGIDSRRDYNMRYDKNQNMYCLAGSGIYKLTSGSGVTAKKIAEIADHTDFRVDWNGNVLYNDYQNTMCVTPGGKSFHIDNLPTERCWYFVTPFYDYADGGFLYWEWDNGELFLYKYTVNESTESGDKELLKTLPFSRRPEYIPDGHIRYDRSLIILSDKTVFNDHNAVIVVKNPGYIKAVNKQISNILHISDNYIYWIDNNCIKSTDIDADATTTIFSFAPNRYYGDYSFADDLILFYATDKQIKDMRLYEDKTKGAMGKQMKKIKAMTQAYLNQNYAADTVIDGIREQLR